MNAPETNRCRLPLARREVVPFLHNEIHERGVSFCRGSQSSLYWVVLHLLLLLFQRGTVVHWRSDRDGIVVRSIGCRSVIEDVLWAWIGHGKKRPGSLISCLVLMTRHQPDGEVNTVVAMNERVDPGPGFLQGPIVDAVRTIGSVVLQRVSTQVDMVCDAGISIWWNVGSTLGECQQGTTKLHLHRSPRAMR